MLELDFNQSRLNRRSFLLLVAGSLVLSCVPEKRNDNRKKIQALIRTARLIYPHDKLEDNLFQEVLQELIDGMKNDTQISALVLKGQLELDSHCDGDWLNSTPTQQIKALEIISSSTFFDLIKETTRIRLYRHPKVWAIIGYEGPSAEKGGYLYRGFDDIDWL